MMIISLYIITAIVLSAFFYVMTIQKTSEIGILKAIGITTKLIDIIDFTNFNDYIYRCSYSRSSYFAHQSNLPVSMPFHIDMHNIIIVLVIFMIVGLIGTSLSFIKLIKIDPIEAIGGGQ